MRSSHRVLHALLALTLTSALAAAQGPPEDAGRTFVLVVGVEDYQDPKITDLAYAEDDAQAIYDFFAEDPRSPTTKDRVKLLLGKQATRIGILGAIEQHLARQAVGPSDTAILYFAGHGFSDTQGVYLASSDTQVGQLRDSAVSWAELQRLWSQIGAGRRLLFADACHSGGIEGLRGPGGIARRALAVQVQPSFASVVIAATGANELSMEDKASKHGVFTLSLLSGLRGSADQDRDGNISLGELTSYLMTQVPLEARKAGGTQTPTIRFEGSESFARRLEISRGKPLEVGSEGSELARMAAERKAAERERERAELRSQVAEAKLKKLQGASAEERRRAQAEVTQARSDLAKAQAAAARERERALGGGAGEASSPAAGSSPYARAVERAKGVRGFTYLDSKTFACGGQENTIARFKHAQTGLIFHLVPGGTYARGSASGDSYEQPVREVTIQPFLICATECTQAAWKQVMGTSVAEQRDLADSSWSLHGVSDDRPMYYVSWTESGDFCRKAGLRLPSEAEWEYACRAGTTTEFGFGESEGGLGAYAEFKENNGQETKSVGGKQPNAFGLFDMHGNVWEWCQDAYQDSYTGVPIDGSALDKAGASGRIIRGGGWDYPTFYCRSAFRLGYGRGYRGGDLGFRPARSLP